MADKRTRSDYRFPIAPGQFGARDPGLTTLNADDRDGLAQLMLDAYRGSIDDEGETFNEALEAVDIYLDRCLRPHSFVLKHESAPIAMSLVLVVELNGVHYIDPVAVSAVHKGTGLGRRLVEASLESLAASGVTLAGATITDGNEPSERLFARLGAQRVGPWPPPAPASPVN